MNAVACILPLISLFLGCSSQHASPPMLAASEPQEIAVELLTAGGTLHGTLLLPGGPAPSPVALIIAGSGPTDRDGNSAALPGANNSLKLLAEGLAERGIATVRYDKRGIAASAAAGPQEADLRFHTYVHDAAAWISWLRGDPRFSNVSIVGHSEGSLIGIMAGQDVDLDAFVSIAGPARSAADVLREQLRPQLPANLWEQSERILTSLIEGRTVEQVPAELMALYRPSVQPYMISWLPLNPAEEINRLDAPVLIVQGTTDIQVSVAEAHALHTVRADAEVAIIDGMNHVLKLVPADMAQQQASYSNPELPVAPQLMERVSAFILAAAP
jgi:uncharacterized protein